ncbi:TBC1 domain family member 5 homolog A isoform X2 [Agrilus planipennis]|uniref:TBC1 domain family member 5 homolog A isoform X2 n=1 Tax=Agrilus planipennis TaxID=224129 RepID=A0A1W4XL02_AGRPL|nr:TBC1 domain family member 5 homolog A isoform X2 [Agrilus planipennis]
MGKNKNKKNRNSNNNASSAADVIASGVSFQHVSKEKLGKTKTKKDTVEHGTQSKTSKRSRNKNEIDQAVANEYGSEIEQSINLLEIDNKETNKSIDKYESHNDSTANTTVGILSQEHDANAAQDNNKMFVSISKSKNASTNDKDKNRRKASLDNGHKENEWRTSQYSASFHRTDESKNWRQEDTVHDYSSSNPSNSHNKESREKNYGGSKYKRSNNNKHSFGSNGNCRNEQSKTGNSNFNDEDDFLSKSNADYTKAKYDKYKDTQINRNLNYSDRHWSEIESSHKVLSKTLHYSNIQMLEKFVDDKKFHLWLQNNKDKFSCVTEVEGDLFDSSEDSCLAHCVAEDMSMGSGIAVSFRKNFKSVPYLLNQRQRSGGLAILEDKNRFIYYLVTKKHSKGKPTLSTLWSSLNKLRNHMVENNAMALSIPRIGCGLDRLEWCEVKHMIEYLFFETGINVTVYNLPKQGKKAKENSKKKK